MVMTVRIWSGAAGDSLWNTVGNWDTGVPITGDDVYIISGSASINGYDASAVTLDSLVVGSQYTGTIGTSGAKLQVSATDVDFSGQGVTYLEGDYVTFTVLDTSSSATALNISAGGSDDITTLRILGGSGNINLAASCDITTIEQIGAGGVTLSILDSVDLTGASLTMDSGIVEMGQAIPTITIFGGELKSTIDSGTVTLLEQYGGKVRWNVTAACTITTLTIYAGLFDSSNSISSQFTITNTTIHEQGILNEKSGISNCLFGSALLMEGGEVIYDIGRSITIS